jgi:phage host-nuclease inhibitor protein Gam
MDNQSALIDFEQIYNKVQQFFEVFDALVKSHTQMKTELEQLKANPQKEEYLKKINELEKEIAYLKKTNKTLKETENLIKNKVERLAVKLENIDF